MTTPRPATTTVSTAATRNMYYEFHIPLGIYNVIRKLLDQRTASPNSPNPIVDASKGREWFSQPRPAIQGQVPKPTLFYATSSQYMLDVFGSSVGLVGGGENLPVPSLDGQVFYWDGAPINDPFSRMVDSSLWNVRRVKYTSAAFPAGQSIADGVRNVIQMIEDTPGAFALGGNSQGAAVMSKVYDEIRNGRLQHRRKDLLAGVTFGNPARETNHLWPGASPVRGWDSAENYNSHGFFPAAQRLKNTETLWWDFANEDDPIASVIDTQLGKDWVDLAGLFLSDFNGLDIVAFLGTRLTQLRWNLVGDVIDVLTNVIQGVGNEGHLAYPFAPPPGNPRNGMTSYQIALEYLQEVGENYKTTRAFSNPTEVLQIDFKLPMPINDIAYQAVKVPVTIDVWYLDRQNNWRPMLDENRNALSLTLSASTTENWHSYNAYTSPTIAKAVQFRLIRQPDTAMGTRPYCVGLRNVLIRRNIYDRPSGIRSTTITEDALGNVVDMYIRDWDAPKAIDANPDTFWRSAAQPDADAVVSLYLDVRAEDGSPKIFDALYLDPVYTGNALNIYYTNDEPEGVTLEPSPISINPTTEKNTRWQQGQGLWDVATGIQNSEFTAPFKVGPLVRKNCWIGVEWAPDFNATSPPTTNPVLLEVIPPSNTPPGQYWPRLYCEVVGGYGKIVLEFTNGTTSKLFEAPLSQALVQDEAIRIVAGWAYDAPGSAVYLCVNASNGDQIGYTYIPNTTDLKELITLDGQISFSYFRGTMTAHVVKLDSWFLKRGNKATTEAEDFLANPTAYVDPDPITTDSEGQTTSSSLDNSVFSCDWTAQRIPIGGMSPSIHVERRWTPIWRDYITQRGNLFFPSKISAKYLKLEFTKLTAEPYPIYDTGIQVTYETFPVTVMADVTTTTTTSTPGTATQTIAIPTVQQVHTPGALEEIVGAVKGVAMAVGDGINGLLGNVGNLSGSGMAHVNWLDPRSVNAANESVLVPTVQPVTAALGAPSTAPSVPNTTATALGRATGATSSPGTDIALRSESTSSLVYRRRSVDSQILASQAVRQQIVGTMSNQGLGATVSTPIATAISTALAPQSALPGGPPIVPAMGKDYWMFPGGLLRMPAAIMQSIFVGVGAGLFGTNSTVRGTTMQTVTVPTTVTTTTSTTRRMRFNTTEKHVYRKLVVTRTAAMGYFAGVREIEAYNTTYIDYEDVLSFDYKLYDPTRWTYSPNILQYPSGAVTTKGSPYAEADLDFVNLDSWTPVGAWSWDGTQDSYSGNRVGSGRVTANGTSLTLTSKKFDVESGAEVVIAGAVKYTNAVSANYPTDFGSNYKGAYSNTTIYAVNDVVAYGGYYYRKILASPVGYVPTTAYWSTRIDPTAQVILELVKYNNGSVVGTQALSPLPAGTPASGYTPPNSLNGNASRVSITNPTGNTDGVTFLHLKGTYSVPEDDVDALAIRFRITSAVTGGQFWVTDARAEPLDGITGTMFSQFTTYSKFSKILCDFRDSGLRRSDSMWADPKNNEAGTLAWYTSPTTLPPGMWGDQYAKWADTNVKWGNRKDSVAVWVDSERKYKGNRSLHFRRAAGAGSAGVRVIQQTNYVPNAYVRVCCTFFKPIQNGNKVTIRLRRVSDGVYIYEEEIANPPVGFWYTHQSVFFDVGAGSDQVYILEISLTGVEEDDLYVSDLYSEIAHIRYHMRLGGVSNPNAPLMEVTELAYAANDAVVTCTTETNEVSVEVDILTPRAAAYGVTLTPVYLQ